ncbi:tetratricopeptide repeat protein [Actinoallomurus soli]|uniref:tetratricopeptide repeat protein n=1 Tax=Actinoallomurus soli TaxID=2952535 RepID=UPI002092E23E|nr:tetratricopeptide repeat protein [Actinoallomurus soli]MCO5974812.1 tetratricopeptide repeat protein [Actinoallomurus soli]
MVLEATAPGMDADAYIDALAQKATAADIPYVVLTPPHVPEDTDAPAETAPETTGTAPGTGDASPGGRGISPVGGRDRSGTATGRTPPEIALLDSLAKPGAWPGDRPAGRYRFPRSDLVRSFEEAVRSAAEKNRAQPSSTTPAEEWYDAAVLLPWTRRPLTAPVWWSTVIVLIAAIFGGIAQGIADKTRIGTLLAGCFAVLAVAALVVGLSNRRIWLPILSRVGFGTRYRWLAASSFFAVQGNRGFGGRLHLQLDQIHKALTAASADAAKAADFWLQVKAFAFLEDLRARHRKLSFTLRGFKRPVPSVVFLRGITRQNGGVGLLLAISDVRSRRSELHPLLVVASVDHAHHADIDDLPGALPPEEGLSPQGRHQNWIASLARTQGPSAQVALPWVLRLPIPVKNPRRAAPPPLKPRTRPWWAWLSRLLALAADIILLVGIIAGFVAAVDDVGLRPVWAATEICLVILGLMIPLVRAARRQNTQRRRVLEAVDAVSRTTQRGLDVRWVIEAEPILRRFVRLRFRRDPRMIAAAANLAATLRAGGCPAEAELILDKALAAARRLRVTDPTRDLRLRANHAAIRLDLGDAPSAARLLREALDDAERELGPEHPEVISARGDLAAALRALGRLDEAEAQSRAVLESAERLPTADAEEILRIKNNHAAILRDRNASGEAETLLRSLLEDTHHPLSSSHAQSLTIRAGLAALLHDRGQHAEAINLLDEVVIQRSRQLGNKHPATLEARSSLAFARLSAGDTDGAERDFAAVLEDAEDATGYTGLPTIIERANTGLSMAQGAGT